MMNIDNNLKTQLLQHLKTADVTQVMFEKTDTSIQVINDIALIQSFYGLDIDRIHATTRALRYMIESNYKPAEWIFIESQDDESLACFRWIQNYGAKYIFIKSSEKQKYLFLKTPLWNIGVLNCKSNNLCFVDSDIVFCNSDWLKTVSEKFNEYDVLSLTSQCYYELTGTELIDTIGYKFVKNINLFNKDNQHNNKLLYQFGHAGFTFGIKRNVLYEIGFFDVTIILDDIWEWTKIFGNAYIYNKNEWLPYKTASMKYGIDVKIGYADEICCHLFHGEVSTRKYRTLIDIIKNHTNDPYDFIEYSDKTKLPCWKIDNLLNKTIFDAVQNAHNSNETNGKLLYIKSAMTNLKNVDFNEKNVVFITTYNKGFRVNENTILNLRKNIFDTYGNKFSFVVLTKEKINKPGIQIINCQVDQEDLCSYVLSNLEFQPNSYIICIPNNFVFSNTTHIFNVDDNFVHTDGKISIFTNNCNIESRIINNPQMYITNE